MADEPTTSTRRRFLSASAGASGAAIAGCLQENPGARPDGGGDGGGGVDSGTGELSGAVEISGSSTVFPLAEAMAEEFKKRHPGVEFDVRSTGSGGGFKNFFCQVDTHLNNASREIKESELENCRSNGVNPVELQVATDALTVVVNNEADFVDCVTVEELRQIWKPDGAERWSDVRDDWPDEEFELYGAATTSGTFDYFTEAIMGEADAHREDYSATEKDRQIVQGVQGSRYAMGYSGFSYYYNNLDQVKALEIDDGDGCYEPSLETASNGNYQPLSRPLFTYPAKEALRDPAVREFARFWVRNTTNDKIVAERVGYVPNTEATKNQILGRLETAIKEVREESA
jgi:phosphate transport system substrate-binding protein